MKRKAYIKPQMDVVPFYGGDLLDTVLPGSNVGYEQWGKEFDLEFEKKEDLGKYFFFNDPWEVAED